MKTRIHVKNKLNKQAKSTFSYMVWEGKIEQHKYACLTDEQKKVLEGANKRLRILTPAMKKKEKH